MNITTLPISYRRNRPFRILFTPFIANCIFEMCESDKQIYPINARGLRDDITDEGDLLALKMSYTNDLGMIGIDTKSSSIFTDKDPDYTFFLKNSIKRGLQSNKYFIATQAVSFCACGRVEIPTSTLNTMNERSLKLITGTKVERKCKFCNSTLKESVDETLMCELSTAPNVNIVPSKQASKYQAVCSSVDRLVLVSRSHRSYANDVKIDNFVIDPDHCWLYFLNYLHETKGLNDFVIIVGVNQIHFAAQLMSLIQITSPNIRVTLVVSPLINLSNLSFPINKKTTVSQLTELLGNKTAIKIFLALLNQWSREVSEICYSDIALIQKIRIPKTIESSTKITLNLQEFEQYFNRQTILKALKKIRHHKSIDDKVANIFVALFQ